jgi:hypothetical protein
MDGPAVLLPCETRRVDLLRNWISQHCSAALSTAFLAWLLMPETKPANEKSEP